MGYDSYLHHFLHGCHPLHSLSKLNTLLFEGCAFASPMFSFLAQAVRRFMLSLTYSISLNSDSTNFPFYQAIKVRSPLFEGCAFASPMFYL